MISHSNKSIDIEIDKLTNSIENRISGDSFDTMVLDFTKTEKGYKKTNWRFDWIDELEKRTDQSINWLSMRIQTLFKD